MAAPESLERENQNRNTIPIPVYPKGTRILTSVCIPKPE